MALWLAVQALPSELQTQVNSIYGPHFPIEVRHYLAKWIEEKKWEMIDPDNISHEKYAAEFLQLLLREIEAKVLQLNELPFFNKLPDFVAIFKKNYSNNPLELIRVIRQCLQAEMKLLQVAKNLDNQRHFLGPEFEELKRRTQVTDVEIKKMLQEQEGVILEMQKTSIINVRLQQTQEQMRIQQEQQLPVDSATVELATKLKQKKIEIDLDLNQRLKNLQISRKNLQETFHKTIQMIDTTYNKVVHGQLLQWKIEQKLAGNGSPIYDNLALIQEQCGTLTEIIWQNCQQIRQLIELQNQFSLPIIDVDQLPILNFQIRDLLSSLVKETFVIETQPLQVIKTNTKFCAVAKCLVGNKLNLQMIRPQVYAQLINEIQANKIMSNKTPTNEKGYFGENSGEILNNIGTFENNDVTFKNLSLKNVRRSNKKGSESVTDEKFAILFQSIIKIGDGELAFHVWTMSLPVVVIVHGSQEPHAWATVTWDNAFSEFKRSCFAVPETVSWPRVAQILSLKFQTIVGKGLHQQNLNYLASKAFNAPLALEYSSMSISWSQFCKDHLPGRNFTFWEWFYAIIKLTREHLQGPWNEGSILGFVDRNEAENMLQAQSGVQGTFLLRFSDSELGGVTVAWLHKDQLTENPQVLMLEPMTTKKLSIRSLADSLNDIKALNYLFPNTPKDIAFSKYYSTSPQDMEKSGNGYRKLIFVAKILGADMHQEGSPGLSQHFQAFEAQLENETLNPEDGLLDMVTAMAGEMDEQIYPALPISELIRILQTGTSQS